MGAEKLKGQASPNISKKDLLYGILSVFDENTTLREENKIFRIQMGLSKIDGDEEALESPLIKKTKQFYYEWKIEPIISRTALIVEKNEDGKEYRMGFEKWFAGLKKEDIIGWDNELLEDSSMSEIKRFFKSQIHETYKKLYQEYNKEKAEESKKAEEIKEKGGDKDETD